jgi:hypothetical protein
MARHRPKTSPDMTAKADIDAAVRAAEAELSRRAAFSRLTYLEDRIATSPPVPGDPPYVEAFPDLPKS